MNISELIEKLETIGLYPDNEDLMMLDYEGGNGAVTFFDNNGVSYHFPITDNHFDMNAAGHSIRIHYRKQIVIDKSEFCVFNSDHGQVINIDASIIFLDEETLLTKLQKAIESFSTLQLK